MPTRRSRYFQISLVFTILMVVFFLQSFVYLVAKDKISSLSVTRLFGSFGLYGVFFFVFFALLWIPDSTKARIGQIGALLAFGTLVTVLVTPKGIGGDLVFVLAATMAYKYGFLERNTLPKVIVIFSLPVGTRLFLVLFTDELEFRRAIGHFAIAISFIPVLFWIYEDELRRTARQKRDLEYRAQKNLPFVEFGRNVSGIVHDFKNDLGLFSMFGQLLGMNRGVPLTETQLVEYNGYVERLAERIERILTITRLSGGDGVREFDLVDLIQSVLYVFQSNLEFKRIVNLSVDLPGKPVQMRGNPADVVAILENIIRNSCEALVERFGDSEEAISKAFLSLSCTVTADTATVLVSDNGPGIARCAGCSHKDCLTCPLFEIGKTTKDDGSGIGLINVRSAAARIGAEVALESEWGAGVRAEIRIPRHSPVDARIRS